MTENPQGNADNANSLLVVKLDRAQTVYAHNESDRRFWGEVDSTGRVNPDECELKAKLVCIEKNVPIEKDKRDLAIEIAINALEHAHELGYHSPALGHIRKLVGTPISTPLKAGVNTSPIVEYDIGSGLPPGSQSTFVPSNGCTCLHCTGGRNK